MRRAFQISVELMTEASLKKNFYMRFQWWPTVLLEWVTRVAQLLRKKTNFLKCTFLQFFNFFQLLFCQWLENLY